MADWKHALEAVSGALTVINSFASTPGVNTLPYVGAVASATAAITAALNAGIKVAPYVIAIKNTFSNGLPSDEELRALDQRISELEALVDAPLPPKEDGEPD